MERTDRIAGGIFVFILMLLTLNPFNNSIQTLATTAGSTEAIQAFALVFPFLYAGLMFIVLAFTGVELMESTT